MHLESRDMTIFGERAQQKEPKFRKNAHNFWHSSPDSIKKTHSWIALIGIDLSNDIYFVWFRGGHNFSIVFGNDVICYCWAFKLKDFVEHNISYLSRKFQVSRTCGSTVTEGNEKHPPPPQCCTGSKKPSVFRVNHWLKIFLTSWCMSGRYEIIHSADEFRWCI